MAQGAGEVRGGAVGAVGAVGGDVQAVSAIAEALAAHGVRYLDRVYTPTERAAAGGDADPDPRVLAAAYAVKEAVLKVLGDPAGIAPRSVEVVGLDRDAIEIRMHEDGARRAFNTGGYRLHASVTHAGGLVFAVVVAQGAITSRAGLGPVLPGHVNHPRGCA